MTQTHLTTERPEATDALYSTHAVDLAVRFGSRAKQMLRDGRDPYQAARLAGSFGERALAERPNVLTFPGAR